MFISEIYESNQGEGLLTGTPSIFVRTSGCNLRCRFCDTPFTSWRPEGETFSLDHVLKEIEQFAADHVVITGGEPMLAKDLGELTRELHSAGKHITIETAGTVFQSVHCDLMSISPKMSNSTPEESDAGKWAVRHEKRRIQLSVLEDLIKRYNYQLKFVVAAPSDLPEIESLLQNLGGVRPDRVLLMPEGVDREVLEQRQTWLEPICEAKGFGLAQRMHIFWYGNKRGT